MLANIVDYIVGQDDVPAGTLAASTSAEPAGQDDARPVVTGDCGYSDGATRAALGAFGIRAVADLPPIRNTTGGYTVKRLQVARSEAPFWDSWTVIEFAPSRRGRRPTSRCSSSKRPRHHQREPFLPEPAAVRPDPLLHDNVPTRSAQSSRPPGCVQEEERLLRAWDKVRARNQTPHLARRSIARSRRRAEDRSVDVRMPKSNGERQLSTRRVTEHRGANRMSATAKALCAARAVAANAHKCGGGHEVLAMRGRGVSCDYGR